MDMDTNQSSAFPSSFLADFFFSTPLGVARGSIRSPQILLVVQVCCVSKHNVKGVVVIPGRQAGTPLEVEKEGSRCLLSAHCARQIPSASEIDGTTSLKFDSLDIIYKMG